MKRIETHTVLFVLDELEEFDSTSVSHATFRGRKNYGIRVRRVIVNLLTHIVQAEGSAILLNGDLSGYGHRAALSDDQKDTWYAEARKGLEPLDNPVT